MAVRINANLIAKGGGIGILKTVTAAVLMPDIVTEKNVGVSYLGTPVLDRLEFKGNSDIKQVSIDTVVFEVNMNRNIQKTKIQGRNGTVKEYISDGDYIINCKGIISNKDNIYPLEQVRNLVKVFEAQKQVSITSLFLNDTFSITDIVIETWSIPQVEGKRNEIPFSFTASSDVPIDMEELI